MICSNFLLMFSFFRLSWVVAWCSIITGHLLFTDPGWPQTRIMLFLCWNFRWWEPLLSIIGWNIFAKSILRQINLSSSSPCKYKVLRCMINFYQKFHKALKSLKLIFLCLGLGEFEISLRYKILWCCSLPPGDWNGFFSNSITHHVHKKLSNRH